ncbi:MAG: hypothetical protein ACOCV8_05505, partial [Spirochaetota bacterium]
RINKAELSDNTGFILMSDGTAESLYDRRNKQLSPVSKQVLDWLDTNESEEVTKALENNIKTLFIPKTTDDCSIALLKNVELNYKQQKDYIITELKKIVKRFLNKIKSYFS